MNVEVTALGREVLRRQREALPVERLIYMVRLLAATLRDIRLLGEGRILVEVALVRLARSRDVRALQDLRTDLDALVASLGGAPDPVPMPRAVPQVKSRGEALLPGTPPDEVEPVVEAGAGGTLEARWAAVVERVRAARPGAASFLSRATPIESGEGGLVLAFAPDAGFHRTQVERADNRDVVEAAVRSVMGGRVRLSFMTREPEEEPSKAGPAPDGQAQLAARAREDPLVQRVCDTFQGRVVHVRKDEDVVEENE